MSARARDEGSGGKQQQQPLLWPRRHNKDDDGEDIAALEAKVAALEATRAQRVARLARPDYRATVREHIALLHAYNDIRDLGHFLIDKIAVREQRRQSEIMERFGVTVDD